VAARILCGEIISNLNRGIHGDREDFVELVRTIEMSQEAADTANRDRYTEADFVAEWDRE